MRVRLNPVLKIRHFMFLNKLKNNLTFHKYTIYISILQGLISLQCVVTEIWRRQRIVQETTMSRNFKISPFLKLLNKTLKKTTWHCTTAYIYTSLLHGLMSFQCIVTEIWHRQRISRKTTKPKFWRKKHNFYIFCQNWKTT